MANKMAAKGGDNHLRPGRGEISLSMTLAFPSPSST